MNIRWAINDDVENEFRFWLRELLAALRQGLVFAVATGILIALLPRTPGHPGADFARDFWPYLVELAFWLGMFLGMLWSAGKRMGAGLAGVLPWQQPAGDKAATARTFGQWAAFAALAGLTLWLAVGVAQLARMGDVVMFLQAFHPLMAACWLAAGAFALVALCCRSGIQRRIAAARRHERR